MNATELAHLKTVVDYLYADEQRDYIDKGKPAGHIFESVEALRLAHQRLAPHG